MSTPFHSRPKRRPLVSSEPAAPAAAPAASSGPTLSYQQLNFLERVARAPDGMLLPVGPEHRAGKVLVRLKLLQRLGFVMAHLHQHGTLEITDAGHAEIARRRNKTKGAS